MSHGPACASRGQCHRRSAARRLITWPLIVFLVALALRLVYVAQIESIGFFEQPLSDAFVYDQRARGIAAGDWLGPADFVHAPLYAYALGAVYLTLGDDPWTVRAVQCVLGSLACVMVLLAGRRWLDERVGIAAGLLLAVYPPALFFDGLIQKTSLALLLSAVLLWWLAVCRGKPSVWRCILAGVLLSLLTLTRQNALALAPVVLVWLLLEPRSAPRRRRATWSAACLAGLFAALLPWAVRNRVVTGEFVLTTPNLGQNFAMGNHPEGTGTYLPFKRNRSTAEHEQREWTRAAERALGRPLSPREVSDYYRDAALTAIREQPGRWLRLTGKKLLMVWNAYEAPDTEDYYLYQQWSGLLRISDTLWHFGVLGPLAAAGIVLTRGRWRESWFLYAWLIVTTLAVAAFVVFARYRFPLIPVLMLFAGAAIVEGASLVRRRARRPLAPAVLVAVLAAVVMDLPIHHPRRPAVFAYTNHAIALAAQARFVEALDQVDQALDMSPTNADALYVKASVLEDLQRYDKALALYNEAVAAAPDYAGAYSGMGRALMELGDLNEAVRAFSQALAVDPEARSALIGRGVAAARHGRYADALRWFDRAIAAHPDDAEAHLDRGNTLAALDRPDDAAAAYADALERRPDDVDAMFNWALLEARRGRTGTAQDLLGRLLRIDPDHRQAIRLRDMLDEQKR